MGELKSEEAVMARAREFERFVWYLDSWRTPATDYPEGEKEGYRIHRKCYSKGMYEMYGIDDYIFFKATKPLPITYLEQQRGKRWYSWMLDDPPHWRAMEIYASQSKGRVLTTGLGLGLIVHGLAENPGVESVVVVEKSREVMDLVLPNLQHLFEPKKGRPLFVVTLGDFYDFIENDASSGWDTIVVDLWVTKGKDEKLDIYYHKVLPLAVILRSKYPKASITFHGFPTVSDIQFASREMIEKIIDMKRRHIRTEII